LNPIKKMQNLSAEDQTLTLKLFIDEYLGKEVDPVTFPISLRYYQSTKGQIFNDLDNLLLNREKNYESLESQYGLSLVKLIERNRADLVKTCINRQIGGEDGICTVEDFNWSIIKTCSSSNMTGVNDYLVRVEFRLFNSNGNVIIFFEGKIGSEEVEDH
jgi:hypothetical protein